MLSNICLAPDADGSARKSASPLLFMSLRSKPLEHFDEEEAIGLLLHAARRHTGLAANPVNEAANAGNKSHTGNNRMECNGPPF